MYLGSDIIGNTTQYFEYIEIYESDIDWDETGNESLISMYQYRLVERIIALQVSFYALRRMGNCCSTNISVVGKMIRVLIEEYEEKYGIFSNPNGENIW